MVTYAFHWAPIWSGVHSSHSGDLRQSTDQETGPMERGSWVVNTKYTHTQALMVWILVPSVTRGHHHLSPSMCMGL